MFYYFILQGWIFSNLMLGEFLQQELPMNYKTVVSFRGITIVKIKLWFLAIL